MKSPSLQNTLRSVYPPLPSVRMSNGSQELEQVAQPNPSTLVSQKFKRNKKVIVVSRTPNEWSSAEDERLLSIVQKMEPLIWARVAESFEKRSPFACRKRFEKVTGRNC
jgi:hypothetical protein